MTSIRASIKRACEAVLLKAVNRVGTGDRLVLAYHNVVPDGTLPIGDRSLHLPASQFEAQMDALVQEHRVVSLMELLGTSAPGESRVAITFDDAYASAMELGVAACVRRRIPCTVFVSPGLLASTPAWDMLAESGQWSERERSIFLTAKQGRGTSYAPSGTSVDPLLQISDIRALERWSTSEFVRFGNHTMNHPNLESLPPAEVQWELCGASEWIRSRFANSLDPVVAYPYGMIPNNARDHLAQCGAEFGLAVRGGWIRSGQPMSSDRVPRWNVPASITLNGFRLRLRGLLAE